LTSTVPELVDAAAERFGDGVFLRIGDTTRTYAQTREASATMAGALAAHGCRPGDRVAALLSNRIELVDLVLGCAWLGAVVVPLNTGLRGQSLRHVLRDAQPQFLYAEAELADLAVEAGHRGVVWVAGAGDVPAPGVSAPLPPAPVRPSDTASVLFTSGTTGVARGVRCPQGQFGRWGRNVADALRLTSDDTLHTCLPLFHTNALNTLAQAMTVGASCTVDGRFSASRYWSRVADSGATVVHLLGAMAPMLLAQPPGPYDRVHRVRCGLSPATPAAAWEAFRDRFGVTLVDGFGSTETNLVIGSTPEEYRPGHIGTLRQGFDAQVVDADLAPVADGTSGELLVRSHQLHAFSTGYLDGPTLPSDSWRRTGDRVIREPDGWYRFVDRIKDVIRRRGRVGGPRPSGGRRGRRVPRGLRTGRGRGDGRGGGPGGSRTGSGGPRPALRAGSARVRGAPVHRDGPGSAAHRDRQGPQGRAAGARGDGRYLGPRRGPPRMTPEVAPRVAVRLTPGRPGAP